MDIYNPFYRYEFKFPTNETNSSVSLRKDTNGYHGKIILNAGVFNNSSRNCFSDFRSTQSNEVIDSSLWFHKYNELLYEFLSKQCESISLEIILANTKSGDSLNVLERYNQIYACIFVDRNFFSYCLNVFKNTNMIHFTFEIDLLQNENHETLKFFSTQIDLPDRHSDRVRELCLNTYVQTSTSEVWAPLQP